MKIPEPPKPPDKRIVDHPWPRKIFVFSYILICFFGFAICIIIKILEVSQ